MKIIRWGILGCGKIAHKFASDLKLVEGSVLTAVASLNKDRGSAFQNKFTVPILLPDYDALAASADVDIVYVATPHGLHHEHVILCLNHGKAVLCEKAFALNHEQAREMVELARRKKVFLMEAFWTKFLPQFDKLRSLLSGGAIGAVRMIQADFSFRAAEPVPQRLYEPGLGGGALLDIGVYPVFLAQTLLGKPTEVSALINRFDSGTDEQIVICMRFANNALATLSASLAVTSPVEAMIAGTHGRIHLRNRFHNAVSTIELVKGDSSQFVEVEREAGYGYQFEARHAADCLRKGIIESPVMSLQDSLDLMETIDRIKASCELRFPVDN